MNLILNKCVSSHYDRNIHNNWRQDVSIISQLTKSLPKNTVISGAENTRPFECDGLSVYKQEPLAVVLPSEVKKKKKVSKTPKKVSKTWKKGVQIF